MSGHRGNFRVRALAALAAVGCLTAWAGAAHPDLQATAHAVVGQDWLVVPTGFSVPTPYTVSQTQPIIDAVEIPREPYPGNIWSHWGRGLLASNGKYYMGYGDHLGLNAKAYLEEYDPATGIMRVVADLQQPFDPWPGDLPSNFGFGKIHGRISQGTDGNLYFASYYGAWKTENQWFYGDHVFKYNPQSGVISDVGMPMLGWGYPSVHFYAPLGLMYMEAAERKGNAWGQPYNGYMSWSYTDYNADPYNFKLMVYNVNTKKVVFFGDHENFNDGRDTMVDGQGNCYFSNGGVYDGQGNYLGGRLRKYDPVTNTCSDVPTLMPGNKLRRTDGPFPSGKIYAVTGDTNKIFSFNPATNEMVVIATTWSDSASLVISPDERFAYYIPGSHGSIKGCPIVQVDLITGGQKVIAFVETPLLNDMGIYAGGSLNFVISPDGQTLYANLHGGPESDNRWEQDTLLVIQIPELGAIPPIGDVNADFSINGLDLGILAANFGTDEPRGLMTGDLNDDGVVDGLDLGMLSAHFGESYDVGLALGGGAPAPEPGTLALLGLGGLSLLLRRRK